MLGEFVVMQKEEFERMLRMLISEEIEAQIGPLKAVIAIKQKDACDAIGITDDTARNRVNQGKVTTLQRDGSRLVYFQLTELPGLKPRFSRQRKK